MSEQVKLIECPRDAWQGLKGIIPADLKSDYLKALISVGFKHIDAVSFVSPKAVPQMADSEEVLKELDPPDDVEIIGIVVNEKGAQRAIDTKAVSTLGFPYSISETFLRKNQNQSPEEAPEEGRRCGARCGRLHFDGVRKSVWRPLESRRSNRSHLADGSGQFADDFLGGHRWNGQSAADQRTGRRGDGEVRLPRNWCPPSQPSRTSARENSRCLRCRLPAI